jgi:uncharacterized protein (DUF433 family)
MATPDELLKRITFNPEVFGGKPIIRGQRIAVEHVLGMLAGGASVDELLKYYPSLDADDIQACFVYASRIVGRERVELVLTGSEDSSR